MARNLEAQLKKQQQLEFRAAEKGRRIAVQLHKAETRKTIDLLPLMQDTYWLQLTIETRQAVVRYIQAGIQDAKTVRAWEKAGRVGQAPDAEPEAVEPSAMPAAAE